MMRDRRPLALRRARWLFYGAFAGVTALLLLPSEWAAPIEQAQPELLGLPIDLLVHVGAFALLFWLRARLDSFGQGDRLAAVGWSLPLSARELWILVALTAYGALLEVLQIGLRTRTGSWSDVGADAVGCIVGAMLWKLWTRFRPESSS